jgi:hypothetical protein
MSAAVVFYNSALIPARFAAYTIGPLVFIRPAYKTDEGLRRHEMTHVAQFWKSWGFSVIAYELSKKARLQYEAEAYAVQRSYDLSVGKGDKLLLFGGFLVKNYNLGISLDAATAAIKDATR